MTIREIVEKYMLDNKCDGLVLGSLVCSCGVNTDDLIRCGSPLIDCESAYWHWCDECSDDIKNGCKIDWTKKGCYKTEVQK